MQKHYKVDLSSERLYGVCLAACNSFLQHMQSNIAFNPEVLRELWYQQGIVLSADCDLRQLLKQVSVAWQLQEGDGGNVAILIPSGRVLFFADGPNQIVFDPNDREIESSSSMEMDCGNDEEEILYLRLRSARIPQFFARQQDAFDAADRLPPGFLWVWACDNPGSSNKGSKQYLVASLDDFWSWYSDISDRNLYEIIREGRAVCFYADLEYYLEFEENQELIPMDLVNQLKESVRQLWLEETGFDLDPRLWDLNESKEEEEEQQHKVSFHLTHPEMSFRDCSVHKAFCQRLEARAPPSLFVQGRVWNAKNGDHDQKSVFFLDQSVYSVNRCFRLIYSTKAGENRPMLPYGRQAAAALHRDTWERCLISIERPSAHLHPEQPLLREQQQQSRQQQHSVQAQAPQQENTLDQVLSKVIEEHFRPDSMRQVTLDDNGIMTFSMINHRCEEICHDTHNNQVYAVADLKQRVFYAKCHADRSRKGPDHPFPEQLAHLSLVNESDGASELEAGGLSHIWIFPQESVSAQRILRFCKAIFGSGEVADRIPTVAPVTYDSQENQYIIALGICATDGGHLQLFVNRAGACIRCAGGEGRCSRQGWRLERPSRSSTVHGKWDLSFILPRMLPSVAVAFAQEGEGGGDANISQQEAFLQEPNFYKALGFTEAGQLGTKELYSYRLGHIEDWAKNKQVDATPEMRNESGVYELAARIQHKSSIIRRILLEEKNEMAYRECLSIAPDFAYPLNLLPKGPVLLLVALWVHLAKHKGYKRVGEDFYIPTKSPDNVRIFYVPVALDQLLTRVCTFEKTPNLCALMWSSRTTGDMERMLRDENHWPSLQPSKRYLGFSNIVYDLEQNVTLTWDEASKDPNVMPFNCLDEEFPVAALERAKRNCPKVEVVSTGDSKKVTFTPVEGGEEWINTPLFDKPQLDQGFRGDVLHWYYALFGRMFHRVGKTNGDNWEICPCSQGVPGTFKSSTISILQSYLQPGQFAVIATKTEKRFPISAAEGKFMVFLTETGGCDLDKELLKQMTCGDPLTVAVKFKTGSILANFDVPMWFAGNSFLVCSDRDGSLERRFGVFPHTRILKQGQGDTGLVKRIIAQERALILIKCNTLYLAMKQAIHEPIQPLLPKLIRDATREALMQNDSLRSYIAQMYVVEERARCTWSNLWEGYISWCRSTGNQAYAADPHSPEVQTMIHKIGARFKAHKNSLWLVNLRLRTKGDPAYVSVFEVKAMIQDDEQQQEEGDDGDNWSESDKEEKQ